MKKIFLVGLAAVVAVGVAVPVALAGGGNSDAANACKQGGWQNLVRQDGTGFVDQGPCVSYVVNGGVPKAKPTGGSESVRTLTVDGKTSTAITTAQTVLYAGTFTTPPNATVGLTVFNGSDCTGAVAYNAPGYTTTDASGNYSEMSGLTPVAGLYSSRTNVGSSLSNCVNIAVAAAPVDEFALSLAITPNTVAAGTDVTFTGTLTNHATPVPGATVTVTPYSNDSTCTTPAEWGGFAATVDASGLYATAPASTTGAPNGVYYYKASSNGVVSGCEQLTIGVTEAPAVDEATGNVAFAVELDGRLLTGNVEFAAEGTPTSGTGHLTMTNDWGYSLNGAVTCFNRIDDKTAVFSGTITDATLYQTPGYFIAKVVDNGLSGDKIAVFVNEQAPTGGCENPASDILADVTSGDLTVHQA